MKEIKSIIKTYDELSQNQKMALATVIRVEGSSYRREGARMLVMENGNWIGGISGGCLEGDALRKAQLAMFQDKPSVVTYDTTDDDAQSIGVGLGCNGIIDVLITPLPKSSDNALEVLRQCTNERQPNILVTIAHNDQGPAQLYPGYMIRYRDKAQLETTLSKAGLADRLYDDITSVIEKKKSRIGDYQLPNGGSVRVFIEFLTPTIRLLLFGGNYDVFPMAQLGKDLGRHVTIYANPHKLSREIFQQADEVKAKDDLIAIDAYTACILMAHDYKTDLKNLRRLLRTQVPYIGMLGPRKRTDKMLDEMEREGVTLTDHDQGRLHSPVGLDIGALSPEEIALSVLAEITAYFSNRKGGFLKHREGTIHERHF
ncbi:MAG: XdhC family protein [Phaeodactylibacter sp.]|nr:XdhC family protein [Phaeodactylibacter sp.]